MDINKTTNMGWNLDNSYSHLPEKFYTKIEPNPVKSPELIILNKDLAKYLGLDIDALCTPAGIAILAGNKMPEGALPIAQAYAGHQFGHFTMLGDGRVLLIGEQITPQGERFDVQLKGSGKTPYSRGGDGRATIGPMLREYIISEAMYGLGVPTTRSLAVVTTGENIIRETMLPGAILTRVATSHIRVGTFEYISAYGTIKELRLLAEYTLQRHFPDIKTDDNKYLILFKEAIKRQAELIAKWQLIGFIHGVMNTDNMAISGEAIDFGPCAFMDTYDPATVFSSIDQLGRYAYGNQPKIAAWNLARFGETLLPLIHDNQEQAIKIIEKEIADFFEIYHSLWLNGMGTKLGIFTVEPKDKALIIELLDIMKEHQADFTNTFRALTIDELCGMDLFNTKEFTQWKDQWELRLTSQPQSKEEVKQLMRQNNPAIIPRNHQVEEALAAAVKKEDYSVAGELVKVLSEPYKYSPEQNKYSALPPSSTRPYRTFCGT